MYADLINISAPIVKHHHQRNNGAIHYYVHTIHFTGAINGMINTTGSYSVTKIPL